MRIVAILFILFFGIVACESSQKKSVSSGPEISFDTTGISLRSINKLFDRKTFRDKDKSLVSYIKSNPNKVDSVHKVIYILPFGNMKPEIETLLNSELEYLKVFFQLEVKVMERISFDSLQKIKEIKTRMVSESDFSYYSKLKKGDIGDLVEQINADSFLDYVIKPRIPKDAVAVLGITEHDIYNSGYNFLFGISSKKIGLVSTFRLIDYGEMTKHNIRKVVSKQIANMFSIANVKDYDCLLNFHNSLDELVNGKFSISPRALEKLKYAIGFDYVNRFKAIADCWEKEGFKHEAEFNRSCAKLIRK